MLAPFPRILGAGVFVLSLLPARAARAEVLFEANFEGGIIPAPLESGSNLGRWTIVQDVVRRGRYAVRIDLRPTDEGPSGLIRSEADYFPERATFLDHEHYVSWSLLVPTSSAATLESEVQHVVLFWEGDPQFMSFWIAKGWMYFSMPGLADRTVGKIRAGVWHDFIFHVRWSTSPTDGFIEIFYDRNRVVAKTKVQTCDGYGKFMGVGLVHRKGVDVTDVMYLDDIKDATTLDEVKLPQPDGGLPDAMVRVRDAGGREGPPAEQARDGAAARDTAAPPDAAAAQDVAASELESTPEGAAQGVGRGCEYLPRGASPGSPIVLLVLAAVLKRTGRFRLSPRRTRGGPE